MRKILLCGLIAISGFSLVSPVMAKATETNKAVSQVKSVMTVEEWKAEKARLEGLADISYEQLGNKIVDSFGYTGDERDTSLSSLLPSINNKLLSFKDETIFLEFISSNSWIVAYKYNAVRGNFSMHIMSVSNYGPDNIVVDSPYYHMDKSIEQVSAVENIALYKLGNIGGRNPDGIVIPQPSTSSFRANFEINPTLSMSLDKNSVVLNPDSVSSFDIVPSITTNIPYKITMNNDGTLKDVKDEVVYSGVNLTYSDSNATNVNGNVLTYPKSIENTTINVNFGDLSDSDPGILKTGIDVVLSPQ